MQKDIDRFMARIAELEAKLKEMDDKKSTTTTTATLSPAQLSNSAGNIADMAKENSMRFALFRDLHPLIH